MNVVGLVRDVSFLFPTQTARGVRGTICMGPVRKSSGKGAAMPRPFV